MPSNRPDRPGPSRLLAAGAALILTVALAGPVAAQSEPPTTLPSPGPSTTVPPLRPPTTLAEDPFAATCAPGDIVVRPDCGREPTEAGDPGGWLQVSLFFLVCAVVIGITGAVWWRSRRMRDERRRAGLDPVDVARRSGEGLRPQERRSTRSDPVAETSSKRPEASAGR